MNSHRNQIVAALLVGILIGMAAGVELHAYRTRKLDTFAEQGPNSDRVIKGLTQKLGIDDKQAAAIRAASDKRKAEVLALQADVYERFEAIRLALRGDIRSQLTDEQRKKFDDLTASWDVKRKRAEPPPARPPLPRVTP